MISFEIAKKLKAAGLKWEPKHGDCYAETNGLIDLYWSMTVKSPEDTRLQIWLPRLDQLLSEIENRGYGWDLRAIACDEYRCDLLNSHYMFSAMSPEKAAADALLWILEQAAK